MTKRFFIRIVTSMAVVALFSVGFFLPYPVRAAGAVQISGIGEYADPGECVDPEGAGSDYAVILGGDLEGCLYTFVAGSVSNPSGTYREWGSEVFVSHQGEIGSFETTYQFEAKYDSAGEIFGRCQHPIVDGSGTGDFEGVTGRIDMKDDVVLGNFPYRGHLKYP